MIKQKTSVGSKIFDGFNYIFLSVMSLVTLLPFIYIIVASVTPPEILLKERFILIPKGFSLEAYRFVFQTDSIIKALCVSVGITVIGTAFNIFMTVLFAYPLSHKTLRGRSLLTLLIIATMIFSGGMIPGYILIQKLGLIDRFSSIILPGAINTFNLIIFRNFFQELPQELEESGKMDGASYPYILFKILLPLSVPLLATFTIMYGVSHWNSWFNAVLYINDSNKWPIQVILRQVINLSNGLGVSDVLDSGIIMPPESVRMCTIVVAMLPIMLVYPFLQKYFTKGLLLGSVKG